MTIFNSLIRKSFKKIRIWKGKNPPELENLFSNKEALKQKMDDAEQSEDMDALLVLADEHEKVVEDISTFCSEETETL